MSWFSPFRTKCLLGSFLLKRKMNVGIDQFRPVMEATFENYQFSRRSLLWLDPSQHLKIHKLDTFLLFYKKSVCFTGKSNVGSNLHSLSLVDGWILVGSHTARLPLDARAAVLEISQHKDVIRASKFIILCMLTREEKSQWKFQSQKKSQFQWSHRGS